MLTTEAMRDHVNELGQSFNVKVIQTSMDPELAHAGQFMRRCDTCGQNNRLSRPGKVRCGRCKSDLGESRTVGYIKIAQVTDDARYAIALHELGHRLAPWGGFFHELSRDMRNTGQFSTMRDVRLRLEEERAAWDWAEKNALDWTITMEHVKQLSLASYGAMAARYGVKP